MKLPGTDVELPAKLATLLVPVGSIHEDAANPRTTKNVEHLAALMRRFGYTDPVVVNESGMIEAGHQRFYACRLLGATEIPTVVVGHDGLTGTAFNIAHNRSNEVVAEWNREDLGALLALLKDEDELEGLGFEGDELEELLADDPESDDGDGEPPEVDPPADPQCRAGDVIEMGPHKVICGDCRDPIVVGRLIGNDRINVAFTSPPYASQRKYDESSGFKPINPDEYVEWFEAVQAGVRAHLADDGSWFVNIKEHCDDGERVLYVKDLTIAHKRQWGWGFVDEFVWRRKAPPGRWSTRLRNDWEPVFQYSTGTPTPVRHDSVGCHTDVAPSGGNSRTDHMNGHWNMPTGVGPGTAYPGNVLDVGSNSTGGHTAAFPVGLPRFFILAYSDEGDIVFDPFMGSGTTQLAAHRTGRVARGCEISPAYCDVIATRWCAESGAPAYILRGDDRITFDPGDHGPV